MSQISAQLLSNPSIEIRIPDHDVASSQVKDPRIERPRVAFGRDYINSFILQRFTNQSLAVKFEGQINTRQSTNIEFSEPPRPRLSLSQSRKEASLALNAAEARRLASSKVDADIFALINDDLFGG